MRKVGTGAEVKKIASVKVAKSTADEGCDACEVPMKNKCSSNKKIQNNQKAIWNKTALYKFYITKCLQ